jgi:uncharacterized Zn finger protein
MWWRDKPYVSAAERRAETERTKKRLAKAGRILAPVSAAGRKLTTTFWGDSWCKHLESYGDFESRLPRGRTYLRNGSVIDVQIKPGVITALVSGSELYEIKIDLKPLEKSLWSAIKTRCSGKISSLVDLLQGKLSSDVMSAVTDRAAGLFPQPKEIRMKCSCPDSARLCKHLAAVLYGIGVRFDERPELFFQLRTVDHLELIAAASASVKSPKTKAANTLAEDSLADIFGIELAGSVGAPQEPQPPAAESAGTATRKNRRKDGRTAERSARGPAKRTSKTAPVSGAVRTSLAPAAGKTSKVAKRTTPAKPASARRRTPVKASWSDSPS